LESDELHLSPFHTQELAFFCILLRYAEQSRQTEIFLSTITNIIHQTKYKIQQLSASGSRLLANRQRHIPKSKDISMSRFALMALDGTAYLAAIDADGSLIFCHQKTPNTVCARFYPRELPDLIQALFAHALSGTGRISHENLVEIFTAYQAQNS
jgi:hypothetical protein